MKKNKIFLILSALLVTGLTPNVNASIAAYGRVSKPNNQIGIYFGQRTGVDDAHIKYRDNYFKVTIGNSEFDSYCLDPGYNMTGFNISMTCDVRNDAYAMRYLVNHLLDENADSNNHAINQLAMRMVSIKTGFSKSVNNQGKAISDYLDAVANHGNGPLPNEFLYGEDANYEGIINKAYELYTDAMNHNTPESFKDSTMPPEYKNASITFTKTATTNNTNYYEATYTVTSSVNIPGKDIDFTCENCSVTSKTWNGTSGTITIQVPGKKNNCGYTIQMVYKATGYSSSQDKDFLYCQSETTKTIQNQGVVITYDELVTAMNAQGQSYTGATEILASKTETITETDGGNYFKNYCEGGNNCIEQTTVTKPAFCDDAQDQTMKITSPTNVKACILKENDESGNTYEMMSNNYCSVYCKEDYQMTMPGAQFASSGRYFTTRNVVVSGKKTCYTTSPKGQTDDNVTKIDVDTFINDIKKAQQDLVDAYNAYQRELAIKNLRNTATLSESTTKNCNGDEAKSYKVSGTIVYDSYKINGYYDDGRAIISKTSNRESYTSSEWGYQYTTTTDTTYEQDPNSASFISPNDLSLSRPNSYSCEELSPSRNGTKRYQCVALVSKNTCRDTSGHYETSGYTSYTDKSTPINSRASYTTCNKISNNNYSCTDYIFDPRNKVGNEPNWDSNINTAKAKISDSNNKIQALIKSFSLCYTWSTNYCFKPEVTFDYEEQYNSNINFAEIKHKVDNDKTVGVSIEDKINNEYNYGITNNFTNGSVSYLSGSENGIGNDNSATIYTINGIIATHVKKEANANAEFQNKQAFQTNYPHGTIDTIGEGATPRKNYHYLGAIFPVALNTEYGVYNWTLKFSNIGQVMNDSSCNSLGRLDKVAGSLNTNLGYVCVYVVDCPDCEFSCSCPSNLADGYKCIEQQGIHGTVCRIIPPCEGDSCVPSCVGKGCNFCTGGDCIATSDEKYAYRSVSLNDLFPNNRQPGYNWNNQKGQDTIKEIEQNGDSAYQTSQYSYKLTAENMKKIRDYNKQQANSFVGVLEYGNNGNSINATSKFLDDGDKNGYFETIKRNTQWTTYSNVSGNMGPAWK